MTLGLLFDLDGTLVDSDRRHCPAFNRILGEFGRSITIATYKARSMGSSNDRIMRFLFPEGSADEHAALGDRKEALFRASAEHLEPVPGLAALLDWAGEAGCRVGIVTNAPRANAELMLRGLGLSHLVAGVVIGEELERSKPDPLPYLTGLQRLGYTADRAVAFEDSESGVTAAVAAGLYTGGLATGLTPDTLRATGARRVVADFSDPALLGFLHDAAARDGAIGGG